MNIDGLDALLNQFHDMKNNIDDDVDDTLQEKAKEYVDYAASRMPSSA
ncbi:hypothetical protein JMUB7516_27300 [Staphylococcus aureus]